MSIKVLTASLLISAAFASVAASADDGIANSNDSSIFDRDEASVIIALNDRGIRATGVEEWAGVVRAFVEDEQGHTTFQFFQPDRLEAIERN